MFGQDHKTDDPVFRQSAEIPFEGAVLSDQAFALRWYADPPGGGVALDARGHGQSAKPHDPQAYERRRMAHDIVALMDHVGFARANLLGFSMGSHLSLTAGLLWPERFGDLILGGVGGKMLRE